ncbi:MAG: GGDEF domain-containing protein [Lachnospiraceae bacterium]|nr:GGDEF domain-containing protein [Lachnospiraceae bacterium]
MYYSAIGILAAMVLLIENQDIFLNRNGAFEQPAWRVYRRFLLTVLLYYGTDILWGIFESRKLSFLLFTDTTLYFAAMAAGVFFWTQYIVIYLEEKNRFGQILLLSGRILAAVVTALVVINIFVPVLFTVGAECVYHALASRYVILAAQILLLLMISVYALASGIRQRRMKASGEKTGLEKYRTLSFFGLIMAVLLTAQLWFPYFPIYAVAYMLGTCLLRALIVGDEKEKYRLRLAESEKVMVLKQSITALLNNMPALTFSKDAETGVYMACNQAFAEYAHKQSPEEVVGLTDVQIFDEETAKHFVEDDRMALSMDQPYFFYEDVPDAVGNQRQFQTTKLKYIDTSGRLCTLGMSQDMTDMVRVQRENATTKEAYEKARSNSVIYSHIAQTLVRGYADLFYVNLDTEDFVEYHTENDRDEITEVRRGKHFFDSCKKEACAFVYPDDREAFLAALDRDKLLATLEKDNTFMMTYRLLMKDEPVYVSMKVSRMEDDKQGIIIGVTNVDEQMKQQKAAERMQEERIAYARINALTGDFLCIYVVEPEGGNYRLYSATDGIESFGLPKEGSDFFADSRENSHDVVFPDDLERFLAVFTKENVLEEIRRSGIFAISYRMVIDGRVIHTQLKAAMVEEKDSLSLVVGVNDVDAQVRQEEEYRNRLAKAQSEANIDALTGVKNKHAYQAAESRLNRRIEGRMHAKFAIVMLDVNDLKKINDTEGHQAGDIYLCSACDIICQIFKRSPVFRVGGDEFVVIAQGKDYECIDELIARVNDHNAAAVGDGGIVIACGMAKFDNDPAVAAVFERADQNMYENKTRLKDDESRGLF